MRINFLSFVIGHQSRRRCYIYLFVCPLLINFNVSINDKHTDVCEIRLLISTNRMRNICKRFQKKNAQSCKNKLINIVPISGVTTATFRFIHVLPTIPRSKLLFTGRIPILTWKPVIAADFNFSTQDSLSIFHALSDKSSGFTRLIFIICTICHTRTLLICNNPNTTNSMI